MRPRLSIIVAVARNGVIGKENTLPWHIPEDFSWFKKHTYGHPVVMGRKTYESIGKPLAGRENIIITRQQRYNVPGARVFNSVDAALAALERERHDEIFIIGGSQIFHETMDRADRLYLTELQRDFEGDTRLSPLPIDRFRKVFEEQHGGEIPFSFLIYDRKDDHEQANRRDVESG
jgi:dihydrofolate reductase